MPLYVNKPNVSTATGTLAIANGGTGQTAAQAAIDALLPSQTGNSGKVITTNGTTSSWGSPGTTGTMAQIVNTIVTAVSSGSTQIPYDDTIPQNTEGDQYMTLAITPLSTTNKLKIEVVLNFANSTGAATVSMALFQDATANALAAVAGANSSGGIPSQMILTYFMAAGTTSATTFKVRAGCAAAQTFTFNGSAAVRKFGGVIASSITITEIVD